MKKFDKIKEGFEAIDVETVKAETIEHIKTVQRNLTAFASDLADRGTNHDKSKLEDPELAGFVEYTPKLKGATYGSEGYQELLDGLKPTLDHHYGNNSHHPEYHADGIDGMNLLDIVEMLADWCAATKRHDDGNIHKSLEINAKRFKMSPQLVSILTNSIDNFEFNTVESDV